MSEGRVRNGIFEPLEAEANRLIAESLAGVTSQEAKSDILTPWKEADRRRREVVPSGGVADAQILKGIFGRVANTHKTYLNSRDGVARPMRMLESTDPNIEMSGDNRSVSNII